MRLYLANFYFLLVKQWSPSYLISTIDNFSQVIETLSSDLLCKKVTANINLSSYGGKCEKL